jgi:hypothetical protein
MGKEFVTGESADTKLFKAILVPSKLTAISSNFSCELGVKSFQVNSSSLGTNPFLSVSSAISCRKIT